MPIVDRVEAITGRISPWCYQRPVLVLSVAALLTAVSLAGAKQIKLSTNLVALLPKTFPSVQGLDILKKKVGSIGSIAVLLEGKDTKKLQSFADRLAVEAPKLDSIDYVQYQRTGGFFKERGLYFLELEELEDVQERIDAVLRWHKKKANPLLVDLEDTKPPKLDFSDLEKRKGSLGRTVGSDSPYFMNAEGTKLAVFIRPKGFASKLSVAKASIREVRALMKKLAPEKEGIRVQIGGRYAKRIVAQTTIEGDLATTSVVAIVLLLLYIIFHFRSIVAVPLLLLPLVMGVCWMLGFTFVAFGTLNILTAFVGAILLGLGIDHGIHLLSRFQHERKQGRDREQAIAVAFGSTGRGVLLAGLTTAVGFSGLAISEFRAFQEFGIIAGVGIVFLVIAYLTVLPALMKVLGRFVDGGSDKPPRTPLGYKLGRMGFFGSTVILLGLSGLGMTETFDYDFKNLDGGKGPIYQIDPLLDKLVGRQRAPVIVFAPDRKKALEVVKVLRDRKAKNPEGTSIDFVISSAEIVPDNQEEKQELIEELDDVLKKIPDDALKTKEELDKLNKLRKMAKAEPFTNAQLPAEVRRQFSDPGAVLIYPRVSLSNGETVVKLAKDVRGLPVEGATEATGEAMVLADVVLMTFREAPIVVAITLALVFLSMWVLLSSFRLAAFCLLPAVFAVAAGLGLAKLLGIQLNYLNVVIIPVLFGMGVDAGVHLVTRGVFASEQVKEALSETGSAVLGATLTTAAGFGALLTAHHPGLASMGKIALLGLAMILFASLFWLISLFAWRAGK